MFVGTMFLIFGKISVTSRTTISEYETIKTICDENNLCQDYKISCLGDNVVSKTPIRGSEIQYNGYWIDPRDIDDQNKLCD